MLTLLHVSDLHFGPVYAPEVGEALLRSATELKADVIVASGDFTQRAKAKQFAAAREFLDRLPDVPLIVVPGNHDIPLYRVRERLFAPYRNYRKYISAELDTTFERDDAVIVALNTTAPWSKIVDGRVTRRQLEFCDNAFRDAPSAAARIVVAHHHFAPPPDYDDRQSVVRRARLSLDRFAEVEVDLILGGHLHRAYVVNSLDVYPSKDHAGRILIVHSGTTTSTRGRARERGRNSFNLIQIDTGMIRVVQWMFFRDLGGFAPVCRHELPRRDRRYLGDLESAPSGAPG